MARASEISLSWSSLPLVSTHSLVSSACRSTQLVKIARKARIVARTTRMRTASRCRVSGGWVEAIRPQTLRLGSVDRLLCLLEGNARELLVALGRLRGVALGEKVLDLGIACRVDLAGGLASRLQV